MKRLQSYYIHSTKKGMSTGNYTVYTVGFSCPFTGHNRICQPARLLTLARLHARQAEKSFAKSSRLPRRIDEWKQVRNELTSGARIKAKVSDTCTQRSDVSQQVKDCLRCKMFTIWVENQNLGLKWGSGRYNFKLARSFCPFVNYKESHWMRSITLFICFISSTPW